MCKSDLAYEKVGVCLYVHFWLHELSLVFNYAYGYTPLSRFLFSCHCVTFLDGSTFVALALVVVHCVVASQLSRRYLLRCECCSRLVSFCCATSVWFALLFVSWVTGKPGSRAIGVQGNLTFVWQA